MKRNDPRPDPDEPCEHPAGSREKIAVMRRRHTQRRAVHHPDDNRNKVEQRRDPKPPPGVF